MAIRKRLLAAVAVAAPLALLLSACAPGAVSTQPNKQPTSVSKNIASEGDVTLKMLDTFQGGDSTWVNAVIKQFEAKYPNVKISRTTQNFDQVMSTLNLRLADPNGPDIATVNNGWQSEGTLAQAGLILNLDKYASLYGWKSEIPATMQRELEFTPDGKQMGSGSLYAVPTARSSLIGLYYDKGILDSLGLPVPQTLADFEADCAKIKAAGKVPIVYGSEDKGPNTAILLAVQDLYGTAQNIGDFVYSKNGSSGKIADTGIVQAAQTVKKWADAGWLTPNYAGIQYADAVNAFQSGKGAFRFEYTGTFSFTPAQQQSFGYVQLPQVADPSTVVGTGSPSANLAISAKSKHPDAAAAFLDFIAGKEAAQLGVDQGDLPLLHSGLSVPSNNPEFATEVAGQNALDKDNGYVPYFDWSTPTMLDTLGTQLQLLLAGRATPDQLAQAAQQDYDKFQTQQKNG
ncbi:MAG: extracellular solute-binding protein [Microbacteriaceae bacterium]|nr:extracellular solute-binding protein [Microbacteriaceae bacterium]MCL2793712.1 extracellular solute-binding protein [Microbacteriaceae bacterium]